MHRKGGIFGMKNFEKIKNNFEMFLVEAGEDGAAFQFTFSKIVFRVVASFGDGWDHVSVSLDKPRCPTWGEMCFIKDLFFEPEEVVMQLHPARSEYIDVHPHCLHLWKPQSTTIPTPNKGLVG